MDEHICFIRIHYYDFSADKCFETCVVTSDIRSAIYLFNKDHKNSKILCVIDEFNVDCDMYSLYSDALEDFFDVYEDCIYIKKDKK